MSRGLALAAGGTAALGALAGVGFRAGRSVVGGGSVEAATEGGPDPLATCDDPEASTTTEGKINDAAAGGDATSSDR
jgi:hypothetical protein